MSEDLCEVIADWFANHPGGQYTICENPTDIPLGLDEDQQGMSPDKAHYHFDKTLGRASWGCVRGFHVLRHSFASNLAAAGIDQRVIDEWMGHQTDAMRKRYRHLFPKQQKSAIDLVFGGTRK
jgi:integrase